MQNKTEATGHDPVQPVELSYGKGARLAYQTALVIDDSHLAQTYDKLRRTHAAHIAPVAERVEADLAIQSALLAGMENRMNDRSADNNRTLNAARQNFVDMGLLQPKRNVFEYDTQIPVTIKPPTLGQTIENFGTVGIERGLSLAVHGLFYRTSYSKP